MTYLHGKFVWFEHWSGTTDRAREFYRALLGWSSDPIPMGANRYNMIMNGAQGIGGFMAAPPGMPAQWVSYLSVPDVNAAAANASGAGATVMMPPTDFAPAGRAAVIADPQGATLSLWKGAEGDRPDADQVAPGDWYWNECCTSDNRAALAFYEKVFGFTHEAMDMGPQGTYYILMKDGVARGGLMNTPAGGPPPYWQPYVSVADCDAACAKAQALGAKLMVPPTDIPGGVGRFTLLADPAGAMIGLIKGRHTG